MSRDSRPDEPARKRPPAPLPILPVVEPGPDEADLEGEEEPRAVLITGAAGKLGRLLRAAWDDRYLVIPLDRRTPDDDPDVIPADLARWDDDWLAHVDEADVVVHLAAHSDIEADWDALTPDTIDGTVHVLHAAALAGVERVVIASTIKVTGDAAAPERLAPGSPHAAAKLLAERLGAGTAAAFGVTVVALRLGWVKPPDAPAPASGVPWIDADAFVRLATRAVEAALEPGTFVAVPGVAPEAGLPWSTDQADAVLGEAEA
jgi:nucleoside-diphosphate-sugar epimerase